MRPAVLLLLLALGLAGAQAQVAGRDTGEAVTPVSTAMEAGSEDFVAGVSTGICACGAGAATPECETAVQEFCRDQPNAKVCAQAATFKDIVASQTARINAGKFLVDYLITECKYQFPKKTSGCDCIEDFESVKCNQAAWEACRRANTMCPAMHYGEAGGAGSMESFGSFIQQRCAKGLAETEVTMKYEDMDEPTWKNTTAEGTAAALSNITGLPPYMISSTAQQVTEDNMEPIKGGGRKMMEGWVQKQVTKMVVKYTMRSMMKKQAGVINSLTGASADNGKGFFDKFSYYGVPARPFISSPSVSDGKWFGGPLAAAVTGAAASGAGAAGANRDAAGAAAGGAGADAAGAATGGAGVRSAGAKNFSPGQIAGIVIGCVLGALLLGLCPLICCFLCLRKKKKKEQKVVEGTAAATAHKEAAVEHTEERYHKDPTTSPDDDERYQDQDTGRDTTGGVTEDVADTTESGAAGIQ